MIFELTEETIVKDAAYDTMLENLVKRLKKQLVKIYKIHDRESTFIPPIIAKTNLN